jgi:hypothetical protein
MHAQPSVVPPARASTSLVMVRVAQVVVSLVTAFWTWFAVSVGLSEGRPALMPVLGITLPLLTIAALAWKFPRVAGVLAIIASVASAIIFHHPAPWGMMALPLAISGVTLLVVRPRR